MARKITISPGGRWLLDELVTRYRSGVAECGEPIGISTVNFSSAAAPELVDMNTLNGLIRRGWAEKRPNGLHYATVDGVVALDGIASPEPTPLRRQRRGGACDPRQRAATGPELPVTREQPKRIVLSDAEKMALANLLRVTGDEFADVEEGAGAPIGTLDALMARIKAAG